MTFELPPLFPPEPCVHPQVQVLNPSLLQHCPHCTTFWSLPKDVHGGALGDREWVDIHDPDGHDYRLALHPTTAKVVAADGTVLWQRP